MKGKILLSALEVLKDCALSQIDFFEAVLASGYGASMGKIDYEFSKRQKARNAAMSLEQESKERSKKLMNFIYQMKYDGLIREIKEKGKFKLSKKGKDKIKELKNKLPDRHYPKKNQKNMVIVSFDVPERLRRKRNWLREVIKNLGFGMIHQSVWVGKIKIPEQLIFDLENMRILEYVEIFEVTKLGSLKKI